MSEIVRTFARLREADPGRALIHLPAAGRSLTAADIWRGALGCRHALEAYGFSPGHLVIAAVGNRPAAVELLLATRALDLAILAVDVDTTAPELDELRDRFGAAAVIVATGGALGLSGHRTSLSDALQIVGPDAAAPAAYGDVSLLKLTSGSTGLPKAARTTDAHLIADTRQIIAAMGIGPDDTQMASIPLSHAYGLSVILLPLLLQGTPIVLRESFVPHQFPADARAFGARTFAGVPFMFEHFVANPPSDGWPEPLTRLISAGARLPPETIEGFYSRFGLKIHSFYGASETGGISYDASDDVAGADSVGWPLPGVTITFRADPDAPAGTGRVHVAGAGVAAGYVADPSDEFCDGGFLTGDYGAFDALGRLTLLGRVSSFINVAGRKVQPSEVEDVLRQMPGVRDVRVLAAPDPQRGEQVVACVAVAPADRAGVTTLTVRQFCSSRLARYKIPRVVIVLDAIPLTARGKTDRRALEEAIRAGAGGMAQYMC